MRLSPKPWIEKNGVQPVASGNVAVPPTGGSGIPPKPHPLGRMTIEEAMRRTGTTSPKQALAKLNEGRVGRQRYSYMPHTGARSRARYKRQLEKECAREAAKAQAAE